MCHRQIKTGDRKRRVTNDMQMRTTECVLRSGWMQKMSGEKKDGFRASTSHQNGRMAGQI